MHYSRCLPRLRKLPLGEIAQLAGLPVKLFQAGYSKEQEFEADRQGTRLAVRAGYSPYGAIDTFRTVENRYQHRSAPPQTPQEEILRGTWETLEGYFRSHPPVLERISQIERLIEAEGWRNRTAQKSLDANVQVALGVQAAQLQASE